MLKTSLISFTAATVLAFKALVPDASVLISGVDAAIAIGTDGRAVIAHRTLTNGASALRITHCDNAPCTGLGNVSTTIDAPTGIDVARAMAIAVPADGRPVVAHSTQDGMLRVTRCANAPCTSATTEAVPVPSGVAIGPVALRIGVDGLPLIAFRDFVANAPAVLHCGNLSCSGGNALTLLDDSPIDGGYDLSMRVGADGLPVVAHRQPGPGVLRVVKCGTLTCQ